MTDTRETMLKRAARAVERLRLVNYHPSSEDIARAVLEAIRDPDKEMWQAGTKAIDESRDFTTDSYETYEVTEPSDYPAPCWHAMIDSILQRG